MTSKVSVQSILKVHSIRAWTLPSWWIRPSCYHLYKQLLAFRDVIIQHAPPRRCPEYVVWRSIDCFSRGFLVLMRPLVVTLCIISCVYEHHSRRWWSVQIPSVVFNFVYWYYSITIYYNKWPSPHICSTTMNTTGTSDQLDADLLGHLFHFI